MLPRITPIAPVRIAAPFDREDWLFELKMDGWRCVAYVEDGACELVSRNGNVYKGFARLANEVATLPVKNAIVDAELVCIDDQGRSVFLDLMRRRKAEAILYCFDLLWLDGIDLRPLPLLDRKRKLQTLLKGQTSCMFAKHVEAKGVDLFKLICELDGEGIVAKHKAGPYTTAPKSWFKILNPAYTQKRGRKELFDKFRERRPPMVSFANE